MIGSSFRSKHSHTSRTGLVCSLGWRVVPPVDLACAVLLCNVDCPCNVCFQEWGFSPEASFHAAPPVGPATTVKLVAVADLGQAEDDGSMEQGEMAPSLNTTGGVGLCVCSTHMVCR